MILGPIEIGQRVYINSAIVLTQVLILEGRLVIVLICRHDKFPKRGKFTIFFHVQPTEKKYFSILMKWKRLRVLFKPFYLFFLSNRLSFHWLSFAWKQIPFILFFIFYSDQTLDNPNGAVVELSAEKAEEPEADDEDEIDGHSSSITGKCF